jgi:hypothetical protein
VKGFSIVGTLSLKKNEPIKTRRIMPYIHEMLNLGILPVGFTGLGFGVLFSINVSCCLSEF